MWPFKKEKITGVRCDMCCHLTAETRRMGQLCASCNKRAEKLIVRLYEENNEGMTAFAMKAGIDTPALQHLIRRGYIAASRPIPEMN